MPSFVPRKFRDATRATYTLQLCPGNRLKPRRGGYNPRLPWPWLKVVVPPAMAIIASQFIGESSMFEFVRVPSSLCACRGLLPSESSPLFLVSASVILPRAVIDSVRAARDMPNGGATNRFAVWGHS